MSLGMGWYSLTATADRMVNVINVVLLPRSLRQILSTIYHPIEDNLLQRDWPYNAAQRKRWVRQATPGDSINKFCTY